MKDQGRKAAIAEYKERKAVGGIYAVRATASGEVWVGATPTLDTVQNRLLFSLRHGGTRQLSVHTGWNGLQATWDAVGPEGLSFEVVEILDEQTLAYGGQACLRERCAYWAEALAARMI